MTSKTEGWSVFFKVNPSVKSVCNIEDLPRERFIGQGTDASFKSSISDSVAAPAAAVVVLKVTSVCGELVVTTSYW
jgi:hypothetical protein